ncbi:H(+)-transporting V0 sector ATPase subunit a [Basidiobolus ranarum]|uniref:V-type proton ATPase subunit a n=1 Tax=Basidiobolus ranarum TaxID=34480 RepID=A0ABR2WV75_9FUNG
MAKSTYFRSEEMSLVQLYIPAEIARTTVSHLGNHGLIQFRDLNPSLSAFQRAFTDDIKRLNDLERQLVFLSEQCEKEHTPIAQTDLDDPQINHTIGVREINELQEVLYERENRIHHLNDSYEALLKQRQELLEHKYVIELSANIHGAQQQQRNDRNSFQTTNTSTTDNPQAPLFPGNDLETGRNDSDNNISFVAGVIPRDKINVFERILWRTLRGNLYMNQSEIENAFDDVKTDREEHKNVFIIFAHGQELIHKIRKTADAMGASLYPVEENDIQRGIKLLEIDDKIKDLDTIIASTNETRRSELQQTAHNLPTWLITLKKEKAIHHILNLFNYDPNRRALIAEGWCPTIDLGTVQNSLKQAADESGSPVYPIMNQVGTNRKPPTYHRTNKFTDGFQNIVDAYGVARYREVNPGLFTVITFPFLFAVMFGDFGHGIFMSLAALYLVLKEQKLKKVDGGEIFAMMFSGRYIILLMGLFSIYTGLIYNDLFSKAVAWFPSGFAWPTQFVADKPVDAISTGRTYAFGLDYMWHGADNYLIFTNSYKMKMSVILGVLQMSFGISLSLFNHIHFNQKFAIWAEFIPQILFLLCIFGYLCVTIIYKWLINWSTKSISPPSLLNMLIYMFLSPGSVDNANLLFKGQATVQLVLIFIAVICIPWMLLAKPFVLKRLHTREIRNGKVTDVTAHQANKTGDPHDLNPTNDNRKHSDEIEISNSTGSSRAGSVTHHNLAKSDKNHNTAKDLGTYEISNPMVAEEMEAEEPFEFSDVMIHQIIHTIEFCLGCISNTASYLRLWALSLAHNQLSAVLWEMIIDNTISLKFPLNIVGAWAGFAVWFVLTISILLIMEGLSAFLHALRLHWVEFNNKFYEGSGFKYAPFSFRSILKGDDDQ